jgi:hypothetical protein
MTKARIASILLTVFTFLSLFFFPYPATLALSFLASLSFPLTALLVGVLSDALYFSAPHTLPLATLLGVLASAIAFFVRRFIKARIIT